MTKIKRSIAELISTPSLPCERCESGTIPAKTYSDGYTMKARPCPYCDGSGTFSCPDLPAIARAIKGRKLLRSKRPEPSREYYVWRFARFHGGQDVCLPMAASFDIEGDPYRPLLDALSELVARRVYGSDMAGSIRWAHAMGHVVSDAYSRGGDLPPSAMPGGPVVMDSHKPFTEALELI